MNYKDMYKKERDRVMDCHSVLGRLNAAADGYFHTDIDTPEKAYDDARRMLAGALGREYIEATR